MKIIFTEENSTSNAEHQYEYIEKSIFNKVMVKLSNIFGGLDYNELKIDENQPREQFEYQYEINDFTGNNVEYWNSKGKDGWEMVQNIESSNKSFTIWKRKLLK